MRSFRRLAICFLVMFSFGAPGIAQEAEEHVHASPGLKRVWDMDTWRFRALRR
jgi:hypothetical protein